MIKQTVIDRDSAVAFVENMETAIEAFDAATGNRNMGLGSQVGATPGLLATARAGIAQVRALNAILIKRYRDDPDLLGEWMAVQWIVEVLKLLRFGVLRGRRWRRGAEG